MTWVLMAPRPLTSTNFMILSSPIGENTVPHMPSSEKNSQWIDPAARINEYIWETTTIHHSYLNKTLNLHLQNFKIWPLSYSLLLCLGHEKTNSIALRSCDSFPGFKNLPEMRCRRNEARTKELPVGTN